MSNEELVYAIQQGEQHRMGELWEQVRLFVIQQARRIPLDGRSDVELDDLIQSGYLALAESVSDYESGEYLFLTHLKYHLKTAFAEATRFRSERQQRETLAGALSLNTPLTDEVDSATMMDLIPDPLGENGLEDAEDRIYQEQLREAVAEVLSELSDEQVELLRLRYWEELSFAEMAALRGMAVNDVRRKEEHAIKRLRKPSTAIKLRHFYDFDYYSYTGLGAFQSTGASIQERYLMKQERIQEREQRRAGKGKNKGNRNPTH